MAEFTHMVSWAHTARVGGPGPVQAPSLCGCIGEGRALVLGKRDSCLLQDPPTGLGWVGAGAWPMLFRLSHDLSLCRKDLDSQPTRETTAEAP